VKGFDGEADYHFMSKTRNARRQVDNWTPLVAPPGDQMVAASPLAL